MPSITLNSFNEPQLKNKSSSFKKAVETLAVVPQSGRISLIARKVYNVMMCHAQIQGINCDQFQIRLRDIATDIEFNSCNLEIIKNHLRKMVSTTVEWQSPTYTEECLWSISGLIAHADLKTKKGELWLEWSYAPNIKKELLDPKRFAKISLAIQASIRSTATLVLYEICSRYADNPGGLTARRAWGWWRPVLTGTPEKPIDAFQEYKYFKRDTLKPAISELNTITNFEVTLLEFKKGRAIQDIQFKIQKKNIVEKTNTLELNPVDLGPISRAVIAGITQIKAEKYVIQYGNKALDAAISRLKERQSQSHLEQIRSPEKFIENLLRSNQFISESEKLDKKEKKSVNKYEETKSERMRLLELYRSNKRVEVKQIFDELSDTEQKDFLSQFEQDETMSNEIIKRAYKAKGLKHLMVKSLFNKFLADKLIGEGWEMPTDTQLLELALLK